MLLWILKYIESFFDMIAFKEELRKIGATFISAGVVGIFLQHILSIGLACWLTLSGVVILFFGLIRRKDT